MTDYMIVSKEWLEDLAKEKDFNEIINTINNRLGLSDKTENTDIASLNHPSLQSIMWMYGIPDMVSDYVQGNLIDEDYISESEHSLKVLFASLYGLDYEGKDGYKRFTTEKLSREEREQVTEHISDQYEHISKKEKIT